MEFTEEEIRGLAAQLRKPEGNPGVEVGQWMNKGNGSMNLHTLAVLNPQPHDRILEIGMGNGYFVRHIVNLDSTIEYTGLDYSDTMVEAAEVINRDFISRNAASFLKGDVHQLPFKAASFHKVFSVNTFYFWQEHVQVLKDIYTALKPGGQMILAVRPKHNLEQFPVTRYGFAILDTDEILSMLQTAGYKNPEVTHIKEPDQEGPMTSNKRETLIIKASKPE